LTPIGIRYKMALMYLIIGLGNPGKEYENTRHNIGFKSIDRLAKAMNIEITKDQHKALTGQGLIEGHKVILAKPQTFMNISGESVGELARWHKIPPSHVIVVYDDMDLPVGQIRIRKAGSDGGHNGMKSIISHLNTSDITRVRVGIGRPLDGVDPSDHVLSTFTKAESAESDIASESAASAVKHILANGIDATMNEYNK
jgi:PTH1 family peptidyl-tRNA hydrolase